MKIAMKPIAAAVGLALISVSAHAALSTPGVSTTGPTSTDLFVAIYDQNDQVSEVVNLGYAYNLLVNTPTLSTGNLTPNSLTAPFVLAANPTGAAGQVLQLNFGVLPSFTSTFANPAASATNYAVFAVNPFLTAGVPEGAIVTSLGAPPSTTSSGLQAVVTGINGEVQNWIANFPTSGFVIDTTCATTLCVQTGPLNGDAPGITASNGAPIGTVLGLYNLQTASRVFTDTAYTNSAGAGFFDLTANGDLTWNVPTAVSAVPLPAAAWLFASGLAGLGAIGRRRRAAA